MQEQITHIIVNEIEYPLVFNLNVMEKIQDKYETIENWGDLTEAKKLEDGTKQEVNIGALKFGIREMINEGIDMENEGQEVKREFLSDKQVGRIITSLGIEKITRDVQNTVIQSTKVEDGNCEKNV